MDKKLLEALNNLSFALEKISDIISQKSDKKSDVGRALSGGDLSKKFEQLNKSLKESIKKNEEENKKLLKESGLGNLNKEFNKIEKSLKSLVDSNKQLITMQKSLSKIKPEIIVSKSKIIIPKLNPIEVPLRYGKLKDLILPIPKPIVVKITFTDPKLPTLPKVKPLVIEIKFTKVPTIPKLPNPQKLEIPIVYSKLPDLPTLAKIEASEIPLKYGKQPDLPTLSEISAQEIPLVYGKQPDLPTLAKIEPQEIRLFYGQIPSIPELAKIPSQEIPLTYGKQPDLPTLVKIEPQEIGLFYGQIPSIPELAKIPSQEIGLTYGQLPLIPELAKIEPQEIRLFYGQIPSIPTLSEIKPQEISLIYGNQPDQPTLTKIQPQEVGLFYGQIPSIPELAKIEPQEIPLVYGQVDLPTLAKIEPQEIELFYGQVPSIPELAKIPSQEIPLVYGQVDLPTLAKIEPQEIGLFYGQVPSIPELAKIEPQEIPLTYGKLPDLPKITKIEAQEIPLKYGKVPTLPKLSKFKSQEISLTYSKLPSLPEFASIKPQEIPLVYGKVPNLPKLGQFKPQIIPVKYDKVPPIPKIAKFKAQEIPIQYGKLPTEPKLRRLKTQEIPLTYGTPAKFVPPKIAKVMIPTEYEKPKGKITRASDRDGGLFGKKGMDTNQTRNIKSGLQLILLMAAGVLALGIAFKIVGKVDFASVVGLALAIGILAVSFSKLAQVRNLTPKNTLSMVGVLIGISLAIMFSSWILRNVKPVGLLQLFTAVMIAGVFAVISLGLGKLLKGLGRISLRGLVFLPLLPFIMVGISMAITASSYILSGVRPIGILQAITSILIAAVFAVISFGLGKLLSGLGKLGPKSILLIPLLPIILVAIAKGIEGASHVLANVKPIGLAQAITSILIAVVFAIVGFGLGKILQGMAKVRDKAQALLISIVMPLVLVAMSAAIAMSSHLLAKVKPISFSQALTAILISVVFVVLSYGLPKIADAVEKVKPQKMVFVPLIMVSMALAITLTSYIFKLIKPVSFSQLMTALGIGLVISVMGFALGFALDKISRFTQKRIQTGAKNLLIIAATLVATSLILALGQYSKYPGADWSMMTAISLGIFGGAIYALDKLKLTFAKVKNGAKSILIIAGVLVATSLILSIGRYNKYPSFTWAFFTTLSLTTFAAGILALDRLKLTFAKVKNGAKSILLIAGLIVATDMILSVGKYNKYPSIPWTFFTALSLVVFGAAIVLLDKLNISVKSVALGSLSVLMIAGTIMATSHILAAGNYTKYPSIKWTLGVAASMIPFGLAAVLLGSITGTGAGAIAMLAGLVSVIGIAATILATSAILESGSYTKYPSVEWTLGVAASLVPFGLAALSLGTIASTGIGAIAIAAGLVSIIAIAGTILAVDKILSSGQYSTSVPLRWTLDTAAVMLPFALAAVAVAPLLPLIAIGGLSIIAISYLIKKTAQILSDGEYSNSVPLQWTINTLAILTPFAIGTVALGALFPLIPFGSLSVLALSYLIVKTANILSGGDYKNPIPLDWTKGTIAALAPFGIGVVGLGMFFPMIALGSLAVIGLSYLIVKTADILSGGNYKNPIPLDWTKNTIAALGPFALGAALLGPMLPFIFLGSLAILGISAVIVKTAEILSKGNYGNYPSEIWSSAVGSSLTAFAAGMGALGTIITGTLGLGAVALAAGSGAVLLVAETIVKASNILAGGNYKDGPSLQWSSAVSQTISAFAQIYKMLNSTSIFDLFFGGGAGPNEFTKTVTMICEAVKLAGDSFSGVSFGSGPPLDWAQGMAATIGAFGEVYKTLSDSGTFKVFGIGGGPSLEEMSSAIVAITHGIKTAADNMQAANYTNYPPKEWSKGVGKAVGGFAPVIEAIGKSGFMGFNRISPEEVEKAVLGITKGIVASAKELNKYKGGFGIYPSYEWAKGVSKSLKGFSSIFEAMNKNNSWWQGSADPDDYIDAMRAVAKGLIAAAEEFDDYEGGFKLDKIPSKDWGKNIAGSFKAFIPGIQAVSEAGGFFTSGASKVKENMAAIGESIKEVSKSIDGGKYNVIIKEAWVQGVKATLDGFAQIVSSIVETDPDEDDFKTVETLVDTIKTISNSLVGGNYTTMINPKWMSNIRSTVDSFLSILESIDEKDLDEDLYETIGTISDTIVTVSNKLKDGNYGFKIKDDWMEGIQKNILSFLQIVSDVSDKDLNTDVYTTVETLSQTIVNVSNILSGGNYTSKIDPNWMSSIQSTVTSFISLLQSVSDAEFTSENFTSVRSLVSSIVDVSKILNDVKWNTIPNDWMTTIKSNSDVYLQFIDSISSVTTTQPEEGQGYFLYGGPVKAFINSIVDTANKLTYGNFNFKIPSDFFSNLKLNTDSYLSMVNSITSANYELPKVTSLIQSLIDITKILPEGNFNLIINPNFIPSLEVNVQYYLKIAEAIKNSDSDFTKISDLCRDLVEVSKIITQGNFDFVINSEYVPNLYSNLSFYVKIAKEAGGIDTSSTIDLVNSLVKVSHIITEGNFSYFINPEYVPSLYTNTIHYLKIIKSVEEADPDYDYMEDLAYNLVNISKVLSEGKYTSLPKDYMTNLRRDVLSLVNLLIEMGKVDLDLAVDNIGETIEISEAVKNVSLILAKGDYSKTIPKEWTQGIGQTLLLFSQTLNSIDSSFGSSFFGKSAVTKAEELADGLIALADKLAKNRASFDLRKAPSAAWSKVIGDTLKAIIPALNYMSSNDGFLTSGSNKFKSNVDALAESMVYFSKKLSMIDTRTTINPNFFKSIADSSKTFLQMLSTIKQSDTDYDTVNDLADSMVELAKAYTKLGEAIGGLNTQLTNVNVEKLGVLKNLAGSVVMLSLMDPAQFSQMMQELESKAGVFLDVMEDTKESSTKDQSVQNTQSPKPTTSTTTTPRPLKAATTGVRTQTVSSPSQRVSDNDKLMAQISKSLSQLSISMSQIQAVVGGPLRTYISTRLSPSRGNDYNLRLGDNT